MSRCAGLANAPTHATVARVPGGGDMLNDAKPATMPAFATRFAIGLAQGLALWAIYHFEPRTDRIAFGALALTAWLIPVVALGALWELRRRTLFAWLLAAAAITASLGAYAAFVDLDASRDWNLFPVGIFTAAILFILHHLVLPADMEQRWRASFERYFDEGWKDAVRLGLAAAFVAVLWALLELGAALFHLIGLDFLKHLLEERWFEFTATTTFFALAVHLTDVRVGLVRGARTLVLTLLSWLLAVPTVIAVGFLLALPFRGLKALWAAGSASGTMLSVCAALIVLMNATYQDGERDEHPPTVLKWFTRIAALALPPLVGVAVYGVALRIGQHGLSPSRIYACACLAIAACYAAGYTWAAVSRGPWMKRLETTNWLTAQIIVAVLLLLFSPIADPARLSVNAQVHRLEAGATRPEKFDYAFLRFKSGRWGRDALARLATRRDGESARSIAALAQAELKTRNPWERPPPTAAERVAALQASGQPLPASFLSQAWGPTEDPSVNCRDVVQGCQALVVELNGDSSPEVVVFGAAGRLVYGLRNGRWAQIGWLAGEQCPGDRDAVARSGVSLTPPVAHSDLEVNSHRLTFVGLDSCPAAAKGAKADNTDDVVDVALVKPVPPPRKGR